MTKTEARRHTARHLSFGHYVKDSTTAYVFCPLCRQTVTATHLAWEKPTPALRARLTDHLTTEH